VPTSRQENEQLLKAIELLAERRQSDPLLQFKPYKLQQDFVDSVLGIKYY
jgi:hypothetical protein